MDDYLAKPFDRDALHRLLEKWCGDLAASQAASSAGRAANCPRLLQPGAGPATLPLQSTRSVTNITAVSAAKPSMAPASSA